MLPARASGMAPRARAGSHPAFPAVFGQELTASLGYPIKWPDLRVLLQDHVHFHTSLLGVFSGRKLKM